MNALSPNPEVQPQKAAGHHTRRFLVSAVFATLLLATSLHAQDLPEANPGRPTVATPATLTPVGYLQFENGGLYAKDSGEFDQQFSLNQVTKLTVHPRLQLLVNWEPFAYTKDAGQHSTEPGGIALGAQAVLIQGDKTHPTLAVSYFHSLYDGTAPDIDIGGNRQEALLLISGDHFGFHSDFNFFVTEQKDSGIRRAQTGQALTLSHDITKNTDVAVELWHFTQPFQHGNAVGLLFTPTWTVKPNLVLDTGFQRGLTGTSTQWEAFVGFTYVLPHRLWPAHRKH